MLFSTWCFCVFHIMFFFFFPTLSDYGQKAVNHKATEVVCVVWWGSAAMTHLSAIRAFAVITCFTSPQRSCRRAALVPRWIAECFHFFIPLIIHTLGPDSIIFPRNVFTKKSNLISVSVFFSVSRKLTWKTFNFPSGNLVNIIRAQIVACWSELHFHFSCLSPHTVTYLWLCPLRVSVPRSFLTVYKLLLPLPHFPPGLS